MEGEGAWIIKHNEYSNESGNIYNALNPEAQILITGHSPGH
jgi:hypothetical protein